MTRRSRVPGMAILVALALAAPSGAGFDHAYDRYAKVIRGHVRMPSVDYSALKKGRAALDAAVDGFAQATDAEERAWTREQRLAEVGLEPLQLQADGRLRGAERIGGAREAGEIGDQHERTDSIEIKDFHFRCKWMKYSSMTVHYSLASLT